MAQNTSVLIENADGTIPLTQEDIDNNIRSKSWTVPPTCHDIVGDTTPLTWDRTESDQGFVLTQGIVYQVVIGGRSTLLQNISDNEDDYIEFSRHGDPCGLWNRLNVGSSLSLSTSIFLLNRTHKQNAKIAVI